MLVKTIIFTLTMAVVTTMLWFKVWEPLGWLNLGGCILIMPLWIWHNYLIFTLIGDDRNSMPLWMAGYLAIDIELDAADTFLRELEASRKKA